MDSILPQSLSQFKCSSLCWTERSGPASEQNSEMNVRFVLLVQPFYIKVLIQQEFRFALIMRRDFEWMDKNGLPGLLGLLLRNLLQLDGQREFSSEGQVGDGDVVEDETELFGSLGQLTVDSGRDLK